MKTRIICFALIFSACLIATNGCSREKRPDGLPVLYPCTITLKQENSPAADVKISLYDGAVSNKWTVSGITDSSGVAKMQTHGQFAGAPSGVFKVVLSKTASEGGLDGDETQPVKKRQETRIYTLVDSKYSREETTPLEVNIGSKPVSESYEIGPAVRELVETIAPDGV